MAMDSLFTAYIVFGDDDASLPALDGQRTLIDNLVERYAVPELVRLDASCAWGWSVAARLTLTSVGVGSSPTMAQGRDARRARCAGRGKLNSLLASAA